MKKTILTLSVVCVLAFVSCKEDASNKTKTDDVTEATESTEAVERDETSKLLPVISFEKSEHDFGTIDAGVAQETVFKFTNTGAGPLIITDASSSCGCTVPEYPKDTPIAPGDTGEMVVKFNGSGQNQITKTITVKANTQKGQEIIKIKAFVNPKEDADSKTGPTSK